ncbi:hypothetical protein JL722_10783 [Aureococcus anophagefferens]|nr:hypothetical protein JL722_10783 [Aureococcus anophagefferens]
MGCPRRLFAAAALWLVTSSQRARPRRDLGASSAATSGQRYKPQRVATYAGPRLGDTLLANHDPDVDAIYRLGPRAALPLPFDFPSSHGRGVVLDGGAVCPFNAQATLFDRAAFWALLLPASVHGRVADIWRGRRAACSGRGARLAFLPPGVTQLRNDHDALADYMSERPLYEKADAVVRVLSGRAAPAGRSVARKFSHGGTKLDTREKRTLPQLLTLAKDEVVARKDAEIAGLREELAALKGDGSDMTGLPAVLRDFTPLAMVDDVAAIADGPELDWY